MKVRLGMLSLLIAASLILTSCSAGQENNVLSVYDAADGYRANVEYTVIEPVAGTLFKFDMTFTKPDKPSYIVTEPEEFKNLELTVENTSSLITYLDSGISLPDGLSTAPASVLFDVPDLISIACRNYESGLKEEKDGLVFKMMNQKLSFGNARCFVYFDKETLAPKRIVVRGVGGEFECIIDFSNFEYFSAKTGE